MSIFEVYGVILLIAVTVLLLVKIYERLVMPVRVGKTTRLETVLYISGSAPELEETVRSLLFLRNSGRLKTQIIIVDEGMDEDTLKTAELLTADCLGVELKSSNSERSFAP